MTRRDSGDPAAARVRFDQWLWAARFYRTRSLATQAVEAGQARLDGERVKPAHPVRTAMQVSVCRQDLVWRVEILEMHSLRRSAGFAASMYRELPESLALREHTLAARRGGHAPGATREGRPTKRDRRRLEDFLNEP